MLLQVNFGTELPCRIVGEEALAAGLFGKFGCRAGFFYRYGLF